MIEAPWGIYSPDQGKNRKIQIGPLQLFLQWVSNEIWIAHRQAPWPTVPDEHEEPEVLKWSRWALSEGDQGIEVLPMMPPLPLLFKPEEAYRILPGASTRIYTRVPLWVRLRTASRKTALAEIPSVSQSRTWFGNTTAGELCLSHYSSVRRFVTDDFFRPHLVGAVLEVQNASNLDLVFHKICLRTDQWSIFSGEGHLWTDPTTVIYRGASSDGEFHTTGKPPVDAVNPVLVSAPRARRNANLAVRTFELLRDIRLF